MKINISSLMVLVLCALVMSSCSKQTTYTDDVSSATGWNFNDPDNGGFEVASARQQETGPGLVFIEGGTFVMGNRKEDVTFERSIKRRVTVSSFYMDETEVSNVEYRFFIHWVKTIHGGKKDVIDRILPDTLVWRRELAFNELLTQTYFRHPSYNFYPVVGVNWEQASEYCVWRSDRVNEQILMNEGIFKPEIILGDTATTAESPSFNTDIYFAKAELYKDRVEENLPSIANSDQQDNSAGRAVRMEDGIMLPKYRLPTEAEWEFAAYALIGNTVEENVYESKVYPWNNKGMRSSEYNNRGEMLANFVRGRGDYMGTASALNDNASITAPVRSYSPNDYNLYCMAGNVSEWVADVYRELSIEDVDEFNPFRGNEFQVAPVINDAAALDTMLTDLGQVKTRTVTAKEIADAGGRWNYSKGDYRNVLDGDYESLLIGTKVKNETEMTDWKGGDAINNVDATNSMYTNSDIDYNSLVNDNVRVIKGGSWRDRAYYLSPGARRFLEQTESRDDIGFRCAMDRVGSPDGF